MMLVDDAFYLDGLFRRRVSEQLQKMAYDEILECLSRACSEFGAISLVLDKTVGRYVSALNVDDVAEIKVIKGQLEKYLEMLELRVGQLLKSSLVIDESTQFWMNNVVYWYVKIVEKVELVCGMVKLNGVKGAEGVLGEIDVVFRLYMKQGKSLYCMYDGHNAVDGSFKLDLSKWPVEYFDKGTGWNL